MNACTYVYVDLCACVYALVSARKLASLIIATSQKN